MVIKWLLPLQPQVHILGRQAGIGGKGGEGGGGRGGGEGKEKVVACIHKRICNREIYRNRKYIRGCQELGGGAWSDWRGDS